MCVTRNLKHAANLIVRNFSLKNEFVPIFQYKIKIEDSLSELCKGT